MISIKQKSDFLGAASSALCLVHCTATPFLFIAHATHFPSEVPTLWKSLDYIFLIISFVAIFWSAKTTSKEWIKFALWISWGILFFMILNESMHWLNLSEYFIYIPSLSLVLFHIYNLKYCQCKDDSCCINHK